MRPVRWYCPPGVAKPSHAIIPGVLACLPDGGPPGAVPGGTCYGGAVEPGEDGWKQHPAGGHWYNYSEAVPALLIRLDTSPRLVRWVEVTGANPSHTWRVPVLMEPVYGDDGETILLFKSALDRVWKCDAWDTPETLHDLQRRLMLVCHALGTDKASLSSAEAVQAALDVLRQGHEFDEHEIVTEGWVSEVLVIRTLVAACGMELSP